MTNVCVESVDSRQGADIYSLHHTFQDWVPARTPTCPRGIRYNLVVSVVGLKTCRGEHLGSIKIKISTGGQKYTIVGQMYTIVAKVQKYNVTRKKGLTRLKPD